LHEVGYILKVTIDYLPGGGFHDPPPLRADAVTAIGASDEWASVFKI
jgi:hypothetical protein